MGPKLNLLSKVALVMIETRHHELAALAVRDCIDRVDFGQVLIFTDNNSHFLAQGLHHPGNVQYVWVPDWHDKQGWSNCCWNGVAPLLNQHLSHVLFIQWDSWILDPLRWKREFLEYDYIGAPWAHTDGHGNVGNGGFSLRSAKLVKFLHEHNVWFPCTTSWDDDLLCRMYRPRLEQYAFKWAPEELAWQFAYEYKRGMNSFGFHGVFNWDYVLPRAELISRLKIAAKSDVIVAHPLLPRLLLKLAGVTDTAMWETTP